MVTPLSTALEDWPKPAEEKSCESAERSIPWRRVRGKSKLAAVTRYLLLALFSLSLRLFAEELAHEDTATGIKFPKEFAQLKFKDIQKLAFPPDSAGSDEIGGYWLRYVTPTGLEVYIYVKEEGKLSKPGDGAKSIWVKKELKSVGVELMHTDNVTAVKQPAEEIVVKAQSVEFLYAKGTYNLRDRPIAFECYVTGFRHRFIKVYAIYDTGTREASEKAVDEAVTGLAKLIKEARVP